MELNGGDKSHVIKNSLKTVTLTPGDYELLCRKQDEGRLMKLEINDDGDSGYINSDVMIQSGARVEASEINSKEDI